MNIDGTSDVLDHYRPLNSAVKTARPIGNLLNSIVYLPLYSAVYF